MAANSLPSLSESVFVQVAPRSGVRSRWMRQPEFSVLDGQSSSPLASWIGLFLIGPRMPSDRRRGGDQVLPPSSEVVIMPHQPPGLGPTLWKRSNGPDFGWNRTGFQQGKRFSGDCTPFATSTGGVQWPFSWRATQMPTSGLRSRVPPNHAATRPFLVSAIVLAWHCLNGAVS